MVYGERVFLNGRPLHYTPWPESVRIRYTERGQEPSDVRLTNEWLDGQFGQAVILIVNNPERPLFADPNNPPVTLKPCEYFVLGDNRPLANDSRNPERGVVRCSEIDGIAIGKVLPLFSRENPLRPRVGSDTDLRR
jgi:hypothetical protein